MNNVIGRNGSGFAGMTGVVRSEPKRGCGGDKDAMVVLVEWTGTWAGQQNWVRVDSLVRS